MTVGSSHAQPWGALGDLRIIDLTQMLAGPYGTMMLADHGAVVIKVEPPEGDMTRRGGPFRKNDTEKVLGGYFQSVDRNKRSVCLDLKTEDGREALKALVKDADAIVENFRSGVMERLGLGYEVLRDINPRIVYGALRGFGDPRTGASPYSEWPAFDVVAQAMGGIMAITGPTRDVPTKIGPGIGDIVPGMMLAFGILSAIHNARRTGEGQFVDVGMTDAVLAICERMVWQHSVEDIVPGPEGNHHPFLCPFGLFPVADGHVTIGAHAQGFFEILCDELGAPELLSDERFSTEQSRSVNRLALIEELSNRTYYFTKSALMSALGGRIPFGPVMNIADISADSHFKAREMLVPVEQPGSDPILIAGVPVKMTATPGAVRTRAPLLGEHTRDELAQAGLDQSQIERILTHNPSAQRG